MTQSSKLTGRKLARLIASCVILNASGLGALRAQTAQPAAAEAGATDTFSTEQLDALLAPIALYPDDLLTQVLMASTFPLEVVEAGRWLDQPGNKDLKGDALEKALESQKWDPSVKSLVPFPEVLALLNSNLDWMQQLGYAFADQQSAVFDSIQRLRRQAQTAGNLQSSPQQVVRQEQQTIIIQPADPNVVYVPNYNPTTVYGAWPYPSYPPVYLPPPAGYYFGTALATGLAFAAGAAVVGGLWGWASPSWGGGYANVNVNRYNNINVNGAKHQFGPMEREPARRKTGRVHATSERAGRKTRPREWFAGGCDWPESSFGAEECCKPAGPFGRRGGGKSSRIGGGAAAGNRPAIGGGAAAGNRPAVGGGAAAGNRPAIGGGAAAGNRPAIGGGAAAGNRPAVGGGAAAGNHVPRPSQPIASNAPGQPARTEPISQQTGRGRVRVLSVA